MLKKHQFAPFVLKTAQIDGQDFEPHGNSRTFAVSEMRSSSPPSAHLASVKPKRTRS